MPSGYAAERAFEQKLELALAIREARRQLHAEERAQRIKAGHATASDIAEITHFPTIGRIE